MGRPRKCAHCGSKATATWDLRPCARGITRTYGLCTRCDVLLNELMAEYRRLKGAV